MISLIIPAFNEEEALRKMLPRLPELVAGQVVRPLLVSDGSTDGTVAVAIEHAIPVLAFSSNCGKGSAVRAALDAVAPSGSDVVVVIDGDGQHLPEDIPRLVRPVLDGEADIAVGSRYAADEGRRNTPLNRYLVRTTTVAILGHLLGRRFTDPYCGFRAFSARILSDVRICGERYEGELEALFDATRCGLRIAEVPIERIYGPATSKMAADGGRIIGRVRAIRQYALTIARKRREMRDTVEVARRRVEEAA
mgnify:CR=1 FL=1